MQVVCKMTEQEPIIDYEPNYLLKFITGSLMDIKAGNSCYVYSEETLNELCEILKSRKIEYEIKKIDDYWCVRRKEDNIGNKNKKREK